MTASMHDDVPPAAQLPDAGSGSGTHRPRGRGGARRPRPEQVGRTIGRIPRLAADALTVRRAFGEPIRHGDVTVVPVARVVGMVGSGFGSGYGSSDGSTGIPEAVRAMGRSGTAAAPGGPGGAKAPAWEAAGEGGGSGGGGGFGLRVTPVGVFVVKGSDVTWQPAFDLNRVALGGQVVGAIALVLLACALRRRSRRH